MSLAEDCVMASHLAPGINMALNPALLPSLLGPLPCHDLCQSSLQSIDELLPAAAQLFLRRDIRESYASRAFQFLRVFVAAKHNKTQLGIVPYPKPILLPPRYLGSIPDKPPYLRSQWPP